MNRCGDGAVKGIAEAFDLGVEGKGLAGGELRKVNEGEERRHEPKERKGKGEKMSRSEMSGGPRAASGFFFFFFFSQKGFSAFASFIRFC